MPSIIELLRCTFVVRYAATKRNQRALVGLMWRARQLYRMALILLAVCMYCSGETAAAATNNNAYNNSKNYMRMSALAHSPQVLVARCGQDTKGRQR